VHFILLVSTSAPPSIANIKQGVDGQSQPAKTSGSFNISTETNFSVALRALDPATEYFCFFVAEEFGFPASNTGIRSIQFFTAGIPLPLTETVTIVLGLNHFIMFFSLLVRFALLVRLNK
jgi:hypothetical protein